MFESHLRHSKLPGPSFGVWPGSPFRGETGDRGPLIRVSIRFESGRNDYLKLPVGYAERGGREGT